VTLLTPALAERLLARSTINVVDQHKADAYATVMAAGQWRSGSLISVYRDGRLRDGMHRCWAVARSGVSIQVVIVVADSWHVRAVSGHSLRSVLKKIARELVESVRRNATIDWSEKEQVRAGMRAAIRRLLTRTATHRTDSPQR